MNQVKKYPVVVGLDIGTTKIAAIVGQMDEYNKVHILGIGKADSQGVARGEVVNIELTVASIKQAVSEAERVSGVEIHEVYVGIAGEHISSMQNNGIQMLGAPDAEVEEHHIKAMIDDMKRIAVNPGERIIHVLPQEFLVDNQPVIGNPIGMSGSRLSANFHIITGKVSAAQHIIKAVERAGLKSMGLILEPLASSASVLTEDEMEAGVALVDIGGGTTDIAIFQDNIIRHTAVIPLAGNILTEDIKSGCSVLRKQAEKLKVRFGHALEHGLSENEIISIPGIAGRAHKEITVINLARIISARLEEIFQHVYFEIKSSGYSKKLIAGIVVTGGGSQLRHLTQFVEYHTGLPTRVGMPTVHLQNAPKDDLKSPILATGIGLILKGYDDMREQGTLRLLKDEQTIMKERIVLQHEVVEEVVQEETVLEAIEEETVVEAAMPTQPYDAPLPPPATNKRKEHFWGKLVKGLDNWLKDPNVHDDFEG